MAQSAKNQVAGSNRPTGPARNRRRPESNPGVGGEIGRSFRVTAQVILELSIRQGETDSRNNAITVRMSGKAEEIEFMPEIEI